MSGLVVVNSSRISCYLQLSRCDPRGYKGSRIQGVEWNAKELQRFESLAKVIRTLFTNIKSLENKPLNPWPLESLDPLLQLMWRRTRNIKWLCHKGFCAMKSLSSSQAQDIPFSAGRQRFKSSWGRHLFNLVCFCRMPLMGILQIILKQEIAGFCRPKIFWIATPYIQ